MIQALTSYEQTSRQNVLAWASLTKGIEAVHQLRYNTGGLAMRMNTGNGGVAHSEYTKLS